MPISAPEADIRETEFEQHVLNSVDLDGSERRHLQRELAHFVVVEQ
ncbi:hypothetical protein ACVWWR_001452 [Bradyrhizobium sp. LM3.2]